MRIKLNFFDVSHILKVYGKFLQGLSMVSRAMMPADALTVKIARTDPSDRRPLGIFFQENTETVS